MLTVICLVFDYEAIFIKRIFLPIVKLNYNTYRKDKWILLKNKSRFRMTLRNRIWVFKCNVYNDIKLIWVAIWYVPLLKSDYWIQVIQRTPRGIQEGSK